jgi:threonine dehydrogenase-like Zn-dependent dehydrogenase
MKAIVFDNRLRFIENYPVPEPEENEALIRISMAGLCNTDIEITKGYGGFKGVLGHEFVGIVERINNRDHRLYGKTVVGEINCGCGICEYCKKGLKNHCPYRKVLGIFNKDGAFAEYITLPLDNVHEVSENISDEEAVFTEPLAAAFEITRQIQIKPENKILVMGDGKLGLLISFVLGLSNSNLTLVGKHKKKLKIAEDRDTKTVLLSDLNIRKDFDIVVDATGSADSFETALKLVKPRGIIVLKSTVAENKEMNLSPVIIDEITVIGSRCGPFEPALDLLSKKLINVRPLITEVFPFSKAKEAFERAMEKDSLKVIIDFRGCLKTSPPLSPSP